MPFIPDLFNFIVVFLFLAAVPLLLLASIVAILGGFVYAVAGPKFRMQMLGRAPGVQLGVDKTVGFGRELHDRHRTESE